MFEGQATSPAQPQPGQAIETKRSGKADRVDGNVQEGSASRCLPPEKSEETVLKFIGSTIGIIFLIGLVVVIGLLALIF